MSSSAGTFFNIVVDGIIEDYFQRNAASVNLEWTYQPVPEWNGPTDDNELIQKALKTKSGGSVFGSKASFADLWNGNVEVLSEMFPRNNPNDPYDRSSADMALAMHLAFWTGKDCERIKRLMFMSKLRRDKWGSPE